MNKEGILILTPFFSPNIGGVETHFDDLVVALDKLGYRVFVHTYSPITTKNVSWEGCERRENSINIRRYRWFGKNLFHKVEKFPAIDFLYLSPYLLVRVFFWMIFNSRKIDVIHAQGFNAAWIGTILKKIFKKRLIVSTHAIYEVDKNSSTAKRIVKILNKADKILTLSRGSYNELISFGLNQEKVDIYKYWIDLNSFKILNKEKFREELKIENKFTVLFVGRLIKKKGIITLAEVARNLPEINFLFIGIGPEAEYLTKIEKELGNVKFLDMVPNHELYKFYNVADLFCIPSQYEEGFGRVVLEAVACGLPVVGSNKGAIPEALNEEVSILVDPNAENLEGAIRKLYLDKEYYEKISSNCRRYAEENYSEKNIKLITRYY